MAKAHPSRSGHALVGCFLALSLPSCDEGMNAAESLGIQATDEPRPYQSEADAILRTELYATWGLEVFRERTWTVWWSDEACPDDPLGASAVVYNGRCFAGLTFWCQAVFVAWRGHISASAYAHELGHCLHIAAGWGGDGEHLDDEWWAAIQRANDRIAEGEGIR